MDERQGKRCFLQVALSGSGQLLVVHAPLPYLRSYNQPSNDQADTVYTYRLVIPD
jgi:hypothetical protein